MPFLEVTIPFNQHLHYRGEYRGTIPHGHSKPICLLLKPLKLQNSWRIFDRPVSFMYCNYEKYECKLQKYLPMINKTWQNNTEYAENMQYRHPPIQEHLVYSHLICRYMYIYVIYTVHIYVCIMSFSEVTILFSQYRGVSWEYRGKIPDGHSNFTYLVLKPLKVQNSDEFSTVPCLSCTANMQNMHVNCKIIYPWPIIHVTICRKNAISYYEY